MLRMLGKPAVPAVVPGICKNGQATRLISTGKLNALPRLHSRPIEVVVYDRP